MSENDTKFSPPKVGPEKPKRVRKPNELPDAIGHVDLASERSEALLTQEAETKAKEEEFLGRFYLLPNKVPYDWRSTKLARKLHRAKKAKASWQR